MRQNRVAIQPKTIENVETYSSGGSSSTTTYKVKTKGGNLHVRTGPSTSYKIIGKLPNGTQIQSSGTEKGWAIHTFKGKKGYSSLNYLVKQNSPTSSSEDGKASMDSTLSGTVALAIPIPNIVANKTVKLQGLGGSLSGNYFVEKVVHTFSSSGYTQDLEVSRKWKGESAKTTTAPPPTPTPNKETVTPTVQTRTYTVKKGDCLWNIAKKYYGKGSEYPKIYNANKDKIKDPNKIYPGQVLTIP